MRHLERVIWAVYGILPGSWPHSLRMVATGYLLCAVLLHVVWMVLKVVAVS